MDPNTEVEDLIKENLRLTRENNRLLHKIRRTHFWDVASRIIFFLIVVGVPLFIYRYYLADYVADLQAAYRNIKSEVESIKELPAQVFPAVADEITNITDRFE